MMQYKMGLMFSFLLGLFCGLAPCFLSDSWALCLGVGLTTSWILFCMWLFYRVNKADKLLADIRSMFYGKGYRAGGKSVDDRFDNNDWSGS